jgi:uncharacterized protein (DUF1501 family)
MKRRDFLKNATLGTILPNLTKDLGIKSFANASILQSLNAVDTDHILIIVQLTGGNDGLNMVIPIDQYPNLSKARQSILIPESKTLPLKGYPNTRLHPSMAALSRKFDEGKICIVQGVGSPTPSFSHFRAIDIWMTGAEGNQFLKSGWAGRYLANEYPNYPVGFPNAAMPDPLAIQMGNGLSLTLYGPNLPMAFALSETNTATTLNTYVSININDSLVQTPHVANEVNFVKSVAKQANDFNASIKNAFNKGENKATYPNNSLANQLKVVAKLISGGLKTRIYNVSTAGFDTHSDQTDPTDTTQGFHAVLLESMSEAIGAFMDDIALLGIEDKVIGMTYSEFGRRIKSNASQGTDHGAASHMLIFGKNIHGGIIGDNPKIAADTTVNDSLPMQYDFRSVYASILKDWFCVAQSDLEKILLKNYQTLKIINAPNCISTDVHETNINAGENIIYNYPNPFDKSTRLKFETLGGHTMIQIFDIEGRLIVIPVDKILDKGLYEVNFDSENLPIGTYYCRLQNGVTTQVHQMVKVR